MKIDIGRLFEKRPSAEIVEISPKEREKILKEAESFVLKVLPSKFALNGGSLTTIDLAMTRSLLEVFVRNEALSRSEAPIVNINIDIYQNALSSFKDFMGGMLDYYELLRGLWISRVKYCVTEIFAKSERVFEPYVIGDLCDKLYLDNKFAMAVIEELKKEDFIKVVDKQYDQNILVKIS